jgi:hypothetical protein
MNRRWINVILAITFAVFLFPGIASANAPAPPPYIWFTFGGQPPIQGMQLVGCRTALCKKPTLLVQSGVCRQSGCLTAQPLLKTSHQFECTQDICLYRESSFSNLPSAPYFKLIGQFQNGVRFSQAFISDFRNPVARYSERHLLVHSVNDELVVRPDRQAIKPSRWEIFGRALAMTQASELVTAAVFFAWKKAARASAIRMLTAIALINLLTFPVVWFFFPSLQSFQYSATRVFGAASVFVAIVFSIVLVNLKNITLKTLIRTFTIWVISLPLVLAIAFIAAFFISYGEFLPSSAGIPTWMTLPASEIFAIVWEGWLLFRFSQNELSLAQASLVSVLMNGVSLALGLAVLPPVS